MLFCFFALTLKRSHLRRLGFNFKVNDTTIQDFRKLSDRITQALQRPTQGLQSAVIALNKETANYVNGRTADICNRWRRVQDNLGKYASQLDQAAIIHKVISNVDGLLIQINIRKDKVWGNNCLILLLLKQIIPDHHEM